MIKLIATDMDGTFLKNDGSFDRQRLHELLNKCDKKGVLFVVASGRSLMTLEKMFAEYGDKVAFIAENGTLVKAGENIIFESGFSKERYLDITDILLKNPYMQGHDFLLSGEKGAYLHPKASKAYFDFSSHYYENVQRVSDLNKVQDNILKVTANFSEDHVRQGEAWFNEHVNYAKAVTTGFQSVDIIVCDVNKRTGLKALCQKMSIDSSDVVAFGDNLNDFEMLEFAGIAVATENARPEIKEISDAVIGHCDEESVIAYMERLVE